MSTNGRCWLGAVLVAGLAGPGMADEGTWQVRNNLAFVDAQGLHNISLWVACDGVVSLLTDMSGMMTWEEAQGLEGLAITIGISIDGAAENPLLTQASVTQINGRLVGQQVAWEARDLVSRLIRGGEVVVSNGSERYRFTLEGSAAAIRSLRCESL